MNATAEETLTCSICGCSSTWRAAFKSVRDGTLTRRCCPACAAGLSRKHRRVRFWILLVAVAFSPVILLQGKGHGLDLLVVIWLMGTCWAHLLVLPHELGHAIAARLVGAPAYAIQIGWEPWLMNREIFGLRWRIGRYLGGGVTFHAPCTGSRARLRTILIYLAGPLTNLLIAMLAFAVVSSKGGLTGSVATLLWLTLGVASALQFVFNLWPRKVENPLGEMFTDGANIVRQLRGHGPDVQVLQGVMHYFRSTLAFEDRHFTLAEREAALAQELWADKEMGAFLIVLRAAALSESDNAPRAIDLLLPVLDAPLTQEGLRAGVADNLAWAYFLLDEPALREKGIELVERACSLAPWDLSYQITKICLLATSANPENVQESRRLLEKIGGERLRGQNAAYAALARGLTAAALGDASLAHSQYATAKSLHATVAPLRVLERRLSN